MASRDIASVDKPSPKKWYGWAVMAMILCLAVSMISAAEAFIPGWSGNLLYIGIIVTAIEAIYSFRVLRLPRSRGISIPRYRLAEACLLGIVLKLVMYMVQTWDRSWAYIGSDLMAMLWQPSAFFARHYAVLLATAWITWMIINRILADFEALHDPYLSHGDRQSPRETLMSRFYWGGGLLVLFIGIDHFGAHASLADQPDLPPPGNYHLHAILYFLLGTLVLSQIRFTSLTAGWRLQDIPVSDCVGKSWTRYGIAFLVLIVTLVTVLPTHDSLGLFDTVLLGLKTVVDLMRRLMELFILAVTLPLSWLLRLLGHGEGGARALPPIPDVPTSPPPPRIEASFPWEIVRAIIFWLTFTAVAIYLIRSYLEDHPELLEGLRNMAFVRRLFHRLATLLALLATWTQRGLAWRPPLIGKPSTAEESGGATLQKRRGWGWSRAKSDRQRVIRAYLQMLRHAAAAGIQRRQHQTPYEYAPKLHRALPDAAGDIKGLTDVFVHVRYSAEPVDHDQAAKAVSHGENLQKAMRQRA